MPTVKESLSIMRLSIEDCALIMDNCFTGLFVTDGDGRIIYVNHRVMDTLGVPFPDALGMNVFQLRDKGFTTYSSTADVLKTGKQVVGTYQNKENRQVAVVSTPVYDENQQLRMVVTYSNEIGSLEDFQKELSHMREALQKQEATIDYMEHMRTPSLVAEDLSMRGIIDMLDTLSDTDSTIMVYGESGVGKEVIAKYIYQHSRRRQSIFIPINCAAIPENLIESELFGYEKGAFTGANRSGKAGIFELANGGTIFLDELGELPLAAQSKLLRVLEAGEYYRVGGTTLQKTDVRIIGATNRDLKEMVAAKTFRADLYYRLNIIPVTVPPLRERPLDLDALATMFLAQYNRKHSKSRSMSAEARAALHSYSWPGNIRELRNVMEQYVLTGSETAFLLQQAGSCTQTAPSDLSLPMACLDGEPAQCLKDAARQFEQRYIQAVLDRCGGNVSQAVSILGISRAAFYDKRKKFHGGPS